MTENKEAPFNSNELNKEWSELLSQYVTNSLLLKKEIESLKFLEQENIDLKVQLHQAQLDIIATQGKVVIDNR